MAEDKNEEVKKAGILVDEMSMDTKERELYEARLMAKYNYDSGMAGAREAGERTKQIQIAKKLKAMKISLNQIKEATGLSEDEINNL